MRSMLIAALFAVVVAGPAPAQGRASVGKGGAVGAAVEVFRREVPEQGVVVVICRETDARMTDAERADSGIPAPTNHRYLYQFVLQGGGSRSGLVWSMPSLLPPAQKGQASDAVTVLDVALSKTTFAVLCLLGDEPVAFVLRLDQKERRSMADPGFRCLVEKTTSASRVIGGKLQGPSPIGGIILTLSHCATAPDGSARITVYRMAPDSRLRTTWWPDPSNRYVDGERPGYLIRREQDTPEPKPGQ